MNVFIIWSGEKSHAVASRLRWFLERVVPGPNYEISDDFEKGRLWRQELAEKLSGSDFGVACITPENRNNRWIHFEAGAIAGNVDEAHLVPYLVHIDPGDLERPLADFQACSSTRSGTLALVQQISGLHGASKPDAVEDVFNQIWGHFEDGLERTLTALEAPSVERDVPEEKIASDEPARPTKIESSSLTIPSWMEVNREHRRVTIDLVAGADPANNNWNFNGYHHGNARIVVPKGYAVIVNFLNDDALSPHSVGVDTQVGDYQASFRSPEPVFDGAISSGAINMSDSTQPEEHETLNFTAAKTGDYALVCYLPGHATAGMWIHFTVAQEDQVGLIEY